ncbi:hypothetical protein DIPPA_64520 [Diplonema papillatum]|nr:hypothetical protein DIPPA_64520 [Diplonema papillatum]
MFQRQRPRYRPSSLSCVAIGGTICLLYFVVVHALWIQRTRPKTSIGHEESAHATKDEPALTTRAPDHEKGADGETQDTEEGARRSTESNEGSNQVAAGGKRVTAQAVDDVELFIVWPGALKHLKRILTDVAQQFEVYYMTRWAPPESLYREDLWRLYWGKGGFARKGMKKKVEQCGGYGAAVVVLVRDRLARYKNIETAHGVDYVNSHTHECKAKYRKWTGGGFKVHGTYSPVEAEHDSFVITGRTASEHLRNTPFTPDGALLFDVSAFLDDLPSRTLHVPSFGQHGWPSCERLYTGIRLVTDAPIFPDLDECRLSERDVHITTSLPSKYDHSLDIRAALIALVCGHNATESPTTWSTAVKNHRNATIAVRFSLV